MKAVVLDGDDQIATINELVCFGCGLCAYHCPVDAICMRPREDFCQPKETPKDLRRAIVSDLMRAQEKT